tara:strand:- start:4173 stop:4457 length:285 start_codon:yes stop_codon:yes gene_type:complete
MGPFQWAKLTTSGRNHIRYFEIAENSMVAVAFTLVREQTEEQKYVADANTLVLEVRLSSTALAEQAFVASEHRIFMAKVISRDPAPRSVLDNLA